MSEIKLSRDNVKHLEALEFMTLKEFASAHGPSQVTNAFSHLDPEIQTLDTLRQYAIGKLQNANTNLEEIQRIKEELENATPRKFRTQMDQTLSKQIRLGSYVIASEEELDGTDVMLDVKDQFFDKKIEQIASNPNEPQNITYIADMYRGFTENEREELLENSDCKQRLKDMFQIMALAPYVLTTDVEDITQEEAARIRTEAMPVIQEYQNALNQKVKELHLNPRKRNNLFWSIKEDLAGRQSAKDEVKEILDELKEDNNKLYVRVSELMQHIQSGKETNKIAIPILLQGPTGTGKSTLMNRLRKALGSASALSYRHQAAFGSKLTHALRNAAYISEEFGAHVFAIADEANRYAPSKDQILGDAKKADEVEELKDTFTDRTYDLSKVIIAYGTNHLEQIERTMLENSRMGSSVRDIFFHGPPAFHTRERFFKKMLEPNGLNKDELAKRCAYQAQGMSFRHLEDTASILNERIKYGQISTEEDAENEVRGIYARNHGAVIDWFMKYAPNTPTFKGNSENRTQIGIVQLDINENKWMIRKKDTNGDFPINEENNEAYKQYVAKRNGQTKPTATNGATVLDADYTIR